MYGFDWDSLGKSWMETNLFSSSIVTIDAQGLDISDGNMRADWGLQDDEREHTWKKSS